MSRCSTRCCNVIITEGLTDEQYIAGHTERLRGAEGEDQRLLAGEDGAGLRHRRRRRCARSRGCTPARKASIIFWGMGISQHVHGTDNARCLIALALVTGQIGRPGTGLHPLRGQNNVQGASDAGLIPMFFPDYQVGRERRPARAVREALGAGARSGARSDGRRDHECDPCRARSTACMSRAKTRRCRTPTCNHARQALAKLEHLVVQDLFLTETAFHADVVLPASAFAEKSGTFTNTDRRVQIGTAGDRSAGRCAAGSVDHPGDRASAWAWPGITRVRARFSPKWPDSCRRSTTSPGSGW